MGGPRVTTGSDSKQDYGTPDDFLGAVKELFGPIVFDLAAHALNKKHPRYFAPPYFTLKYDPDKDKIDGDAVVVSMVGRGAILEEAKFAVERALKEKKKTEIAVPNRDKNAYAIDAFAHSWADLSREFKDPRNGGPGLLWDNCEFNDVEPWADRHAKERELGANSLLLTPAAVGSNWFRDKIAGVADVYLLNGRLCFDGKNVFPKDCMLSHFSPDSSGRVFIWNWRQRTIHRKWDLVVYEAGS